MHAFDNWLDRFCRKHPGFGIPNLMLYIAIANVAVALMDMFALNGPSLSSLLYFSREAILRGQVWRIFTFVLVPESGGLFAVVTAYCYYWIGNLLEREWGTGRFTLFYIGGVVFNIIFGFIVGYASIYYVNLSLFFSFAVLFPDLQILLFFLIPVKVKWLAWLDAALFAWDIIMALLARSFIGALLPVIAILNFLLFFWGDFTEALSYRKRRFQHQHSAQTVNFKKAAKSAYEKKGYIHKCAVCGKTDTDYPDMEFRYCSKCNGYYCYCMEHINDHEHVQ